MNGATDSSVLPCTAEFEVLTIIVLIATTIPNLFLLTVIHVFCRFGLFFFIILFIRRK